MNYRDKINLKKEVLEKYNQLMPMLYRNYGYCNTAEDIRLEVLSILQSHIISKTRDILNKRHRRYSRNKIQAKKITLKKAEDIVFDFSKIEV